MRIARLRPHRDHRERMLASMVAVVTLAVVGLLSSPSALAAGSNYYCDANNPDPYYVPGYSACPDVRSHYVSNYDYNEAYTYYPNDGDYVCQVIEGAAVSGDISRTCGQNSAVSGQDYADEDDTHYWIVGNDSPKEHYVDGYYYYYN